MLPLHRLFPLALCCAAAALGAPTAIPTFECVSVYHPSADKTPCHVHYRTTNTGEWREALDLVYDPRNQEHRGSIVGLSPDTEYEIRLTHGTSVSVIKTRTENDHFPVAKTTFVSSQVTPLEIKESGTATGYHLVTPRPQMRATIDVGNESENNVTVDADYVIIRGLELKNAGRHGVYIKPGRHHVVVEDCHITFWGRIGGPISYGNASNTDSGIYGDRGAGHLVLQRNLIENPRGASNDWDTGHPAGPQGISLINTSGNNVVRYNEILSTDDHGFNDGFGGASNFSNEGSPNRDSDIYGNIIAGVWDDGIESEGANMNVRIWGNYIYRVYQHVATASTSKGPLYIFRNVFGISRKTHVDHIGGAMVKTGGRGEFGGGRKFVFHNTALQPGGAFTVFSGHVDPNTVTRNNIFDCPGRLASSQATDDPGDYDYDFYSGSEPGRAKEKNGVRGKIAFIPSHYLEFYPAPVVNRVQYGKIPVNLGGKEREITDPVVTAPNPVIDRGVRLPNFNDDFAGRAPDIGAFEVGRPPLRFGRRATSNIWAPWELYADDGLPKTNAAR